MNRRETIINRIKELPGLPAVAVNIMQVLRDPDFSMKDLQRNIEFEPSLAANVLKMANSAYFSGSRAISTIREAIMRLGSGTIRDLVLANSVAPVASQSVEGYELSPGALWEHMVSTALATQHLATALKIRLADYAFTAALIHDVGKVALGYAVEAYSHDIMQLAFEEGTPFEQAEREVLGIDHAEAGAILLENWNIPAEIVNVVRWHHTPEESKHEDIVLDMVHIANSLTMTTGMGRGSDGLNYKPSEEVMARHKIRIRIFEKVLTQTMISKEELKSLFGGL